MQRPKIDVRQSKLSDLLYEMEQGKLQVPRFQRNFVWPLTKTRKLLDSMYKEFPIGTFFLWRAPADNPSLSRPLTELGIPAPQDGVEVSYILDGQQRLASLYVTIKGLKLGRRDYGHVSIDLETATCYDQSKEEGFEDDIFVYRSGDNQRYVAVADLVGPEALMIFKGIPEEWQTAFNKAYNLFQTYPFSVVWIQEQELSDAIEIFQRINQAGKRLSRYDLICANVWTEEFDFRKRIASLNRQFARQGFGKLHETIFTQTFALILEDRCTTAAELSLKTDKIVENWDRVIRALQLAINFAANNLGVKRAGHLPYRGILPVLAYYLYHAPHSAISARERETLWRWFWQVTLSERYSSTSPSRMAEDAQKLRGLIQGEEITFDYPAKITPEAVARNRMTRTTSALRNAVICMLALKQPRNLKDGSLVNLSDKFFSNLKKAERHHIFPVGYLKDQRVPATWVHMVPNFCFIPSDLNREIGSRAPADYLAQYEGENPHFDIAAASHLLPINPDAAIWKNDFDGFLKERSALIVSELKLLLDSTPSDFLETVAAEPRGLEISTRVDLLEIRLRDFIDHRLTAVVGPHYWKPTMPGDVVTAVKQLIAEQLSRHPYEDSLQFASGRRRLDFCDVSHYEKIILKNWAQFEEFFQRKEEFQRHIAAYRTLRNCVQHNRQPSDIEQQLGKAAITWLERILDQYEQETLAYSEEDEEELTIEEGEE